MLDDLEALAGKLTELSARVRHLRAENQQLRSQLATAGNELEAMRQRVAHAMARIDALLSQLPAEPSSEPPQDADAAREAR